MTNSKRYCPEPFEHFEVKESGDVHICCPGWVSKRIGNLFEASVMEIWNSLEAQEIRQSVYDGTYKFCNGDYCALVNNLRKNAISNKDEMPPLILPDAPKIYNLGYDRSCNLRCRSCREQYLEIKGEKYEKAKILQDKLLDFGFKGASRLIVTGYGDPFAGTLYTELFKKIDFKKCPDMKIRLFTNAMRMSPDVWNSLFNIHNAVDEFYVSIDAAKAETYEYLRRGAKFSILQERLEFLSELRKNNQIKLLRISFVVQACNFREMVDFVNMGKKYNCDIVYFSRVRNWGTYSKEEFESIAIHEAKHPKHQEFENLLNSPVFDDPIVQLNTLSN